MAKIAKTQVTNYTLFLTESEFNVLSKIVDGLDLDIDENRIHDELMDMFNNMRRSED